MPKQIVLWDLVQGARRCTKSSVRDEQWGEKHTRLEKNYRDRRGRGSREGEIGRLVCRGDLANNENFFVENEKNCRTTICL